MIIQQLNRNEFEDFAQNVDYINDQCQVKDLEPFMYLSMLKNPDSDLNVQKIYQITYIEDYTLSDREKTSKDPLAFIAEPGDTVHHREIHLISPYDFETHVEKYYKRQDDYVKILCDPLSKKPITCAFSYLREHYHREYLKERPPTLTSHGNIC